MKQYTYFLLLFLMTFSGLAQFEDEPVTWSQQVQKGAEGEITLVLKGDILDGWHVYSQHTAEGGSLPSVFTYGKAGEDYELQGPAEESQTLTEYNDIFGVDETFFKKEAVFTQKIKLLRPSVKQITVQLFYQVCKEVCIPKDETFVFVLEEGGPIEATVDVDEKSLMLGNRLKLDLRNTELLNSGSDAVPDSDSSLWMIFGLGLVGGIIALFTPCVFPMIPLTVAFFTKHSQYRSRGLANALMYGFFIIVIYFLLSLPFHLFDSVDSQILNTIATNIWVNIFFFLIFVIFAFSFFGYYELTLPTSWANKMDAASTRVGGLPGIFFMALTLAIVSFSCTGPILGGLLGSTTLAEGDVATNLSAGMLGFGVALALPFGLFAMFPAWLNSLPKSGEWMTTIKVCLGFVELALALKFLSNADLVGNWGLFKREIFLGAWIILSLLLTLYLLGIPASLWRGPVNKSRFRKVAGFLSAICTLYLILGLFKVTHLKLLSGFPPPDFYSVLPQKSDCPLGIDCFKDFEKGLAYARESGKPILLDFTGWACVNCRKMEENVWSEPDIYPILKEDYILISLYVDDRKDLPVGEQFNYRMPSGRVKEITTIGQKWGTFQVLNFGAVSQPYYVLLSPDLELLNGTIQNAGSDEYKEWLLQGLTRHRAAAGTALK